VSRLPRFWAEGRGVPRGSQGVVNGSGKHYSLFCTESALESVFSRLFYKKERKISQHVGAQGENVNI